MLASIGGEISICALLVLKRQLDIQQLDSGAIILRFKGFKLGAFNSLPEVDNAAIEGSVYDEFHSWPKK